ncbi:MAG: phosphodiester glycosidase family protein [Solirubrobacteraceae bacterium]
MKEKVLRDAARPCTPMNAVAKTSARPRRRSLPPRLRPLARARRVLVLALSMCSTLVVVSYTTTMLSPSNSSFTIRSFEWLRDHGAASFAASIETLYYSLNAPATGGPALRKLPLRARPYAASIHPPNIAPLISPRLAGEGRWVPTETWSGSDSPVQIAQFRSDPSYPQMVAGVAWIDIHRAFVQLYPGRLEPSVALPRGPMEVPPDKRPLLLATFNSAFKLADSGGGFAIGGRTYSPLKPGLATLIGYADGRIDIQTWAGGPDVAPSVRFARQNLPLIVSGGRPNPNLSDGSQWGATLGNAVRVWRSGIGVDANGNVIYAAADNQTVASLAEILIRAGAVRAMELDINSYWVTFIAYGLRDAGDPSSLLPGMTRGPDRYLSPDDRDFFAVYLRVRG